MSLEERRVIMDKSVDLNGRRTETFWLNSDHDLVILVK